MKNPIHMIPILIYDKLYTKRECQKILKGLGIRYYKLQVLVTIGAEIQDLECIPIDTRAYQAIKEAKEKGDLTCKIILQPGAPL